MIEENLNIDSSIVISVIVPIYNGAHYITETLESVKRQTFKNFECLIIDDGSGDSTAEIVNNFIKADARFIYIYQDNQGLSAARNTGIDHSKGDFIQFLDADDVLLPAKFELHLDACNLADENENLITYTDYFTGLSEDIYTPSQFYISCRFNTANHLLELIQRWEDTIVIPANAFLFRSSVFKNSNIRFDTELPNHEDFDCWLSIFAKLNPKMYFINQKICIYRMTENSMSKNMKLMGEGFLRVLDKHISSPSYSTEIHNALLIKKRSVLQKYRRFDLMTLKDKILSLDSILNYYRKRLSS